MEPLLLNNIVQDWELCVKGVKCTISALRLYSGTEILKQFQHLCLAALDQHMICMLVGAHAWKS